MQVATPKGTKLQLIDLRGKMYLPVQQRVLWFREEHPDWTIESEIVQFDGKMCLAKATIKDASGKIMANDFKLETTSDFKDHIEKSITGAIGRALALCGYGTAYAIELNEGDDVCDSPAEIKQQQKQNVPWPEDNAPMPEEEFAPSVRDIPNLAPQAPKFKVPDEVSQRLKNNPDNTSAALNWMVPIGKFKGQRMGDVDPKKRWGYAKWIVDNNAEKGKEPSGDYAKFVEYHKLLEDMEMQNKGNGDEIPF